MKKYKVKHITYWFNDFGSVIIEGTKTIKRYIQIRNSGTVDSDLSSEEYIRKILELSEEHNRQIKEECDPQEVYFYEYNNRECCMAFDGDQEAYDMIVNIWGEEIASKIKRI